MCFRVGNLGRRLKYRALVQTWEHLLKIDQRHFQKSNPHVLYERMQKGAQAVRTFVYNLFQESLQNVLHVAAAFIALCNIDIYLAIFALVTGVLYCYLNVKLKLKTVELDHEVEVIQEVEYGKVYRFFANLGSVRLLGIKHTVLRRMRQAFGMLLTVTKQKVKTMILRRTLLSQLESLSNLLVLLYLALRCVYTHANGLTTVTPNNIEGDQGGNFDHQNVDEASVLDDDTFNMSSFNLFFWWGSGQVAFFYLECVTQYVMSLLSTFTKHRFNYSTSTSTSKDFSSGTSQLGISYSQFLVARRTYSDFSSQLRRVLNCYQQLLASRTGLYRLHALWDIREQARTYSQATKHAETLMFASHLAPKIVRFNKVSFSYDLQGLKEQKPTDTPSVTSGSLHNISVDIKHGRRIAVVGRSGSGKTTFVHLLMRLFMPDKGEIMVDEISHASLSDFSLHSIFQIVPQSPLLLPASIRDNLTITATVEDTPTSTIFFDSEESEVEIDDDHLQRTLGLAKAWDFVKEKEDQMNMVLINDNLSGGEKQRLCLARGLVRATPFLILDESCSQVDTVTEERIIHSLFDLPYQPTIIHITHRVHSLGNLGYDRVIVFSEGSIVGDGTFKELEKSNPYFQELLRDANSNDTSQATIH